MKAFRFLFMAVLLMFAVTWSQASIPDTKENSKTEKLKNEISAKMEKQDFKIQKTELNFVVTSYQNFDLVVSEKSDFKIPTKAIQTFSKAVNTDNVKANYRNPRDGIRIIDKGK